MATMYLMSPQMLEKIQKFADSIILTLHHFLKITKISYEITCVFKWKRMKPGWVGFFGLQKQKTTQLQNGITYFC